MLSRSSALPFVSALLVALFVPSLADACLLADRLRVIAPQLTEQEVQQMAHGSMVREVIPYHFEGVQTCRGGMADIFPCRNVNLLSFLRLADIGGGNGNDLWGWTDPLSGKEYALVGRSNGTAFVDVSDPMNPIYLGNLPTHEGQTSTWRDIKVYQNRAYIVADQVDSHGMQVFDLTQLRNVESPPVTFTPTSRYTEFNRAHNVAINEATGFAYAVGSDTCAGGLHMIDLKGIGGPTFAGCFQADGYTHDVQCVIYEGPDVDHKGKEVCFASNEDSVTIVDVSTKETPAMLSRTEYLQNGELGYTHQGWLTEDQRYFVHDDELDELGQGHNTRTYTWDVSDLDQPTVAGFYDAAQPSIDHNQYIKDQHTYQANYNRGLRILEISDPASGHLTEVAYFDTFPEGDATSFGGAWSTYPFFDSGIVMVSDISRGLFILQPTMDSFLFFDGFESGDLSLWSSLVSFHP